MSTAQSCPEVIRLENSLFPHSRNCGRMDKSQLNRTLRRYKILEYKADDKDLNASIFIAFVNQVWQGNYDIEKTQTALSKTLNITAYDNKMLIGAYAFSLMAIILEQLQSCLFFRNIKSKEWEVRSSGSLKIIHPPCYTLEHNRVQRSFMKK